MRGSLKSWSGLVLVTALGACSNIIGVSEIEIDPSLDAPGDGGTSAGGKGSGGKNTGGDSVIPQGGDENGGTAGTSQGGKSAGGTSSGGKSAGGTSSGGNAGTSGDAGAGGEPPSGCPNDCDDEIACTIDECLPSGECEHTADDSACTGAAGKCTSCQVGIGCVDTEPTVKDLELLLDRNFDEQTGDWVDYSNADVILPDAAAQSGTHSAYFSAAPDDNEETAFFDVVQLVHIPAGTIKLTASGWYKMLWAPAVKPMRPRSEEYVMLTLFSPEPVNNDYIEYWTAMSWDATDSPQTTWKSFSYDAPQTALSKLRDVDVTLDLVAETWDTTYYFDSLSLKASVCE